MNNEEIFHPLKYNNINKLNELLNSGIPKNITINHFNQDLSLFEFIISDISSTRNSETFDKIIEILKKHDFSLEIKNKISVSELIFSENVSLNTFNHIKQYFRYIDYDNLYDKLLVKNTFDRETLINKINKLESLGINLLEMSIMSDMNGSYLNIKEPVYNVFHNNRIFESLTCDDLDLLKSKNIDLNNEIILNLALANRDLKRDTLFYLMNEVDVIDTHAQHILRTILLKHISEEDKISLLNSFFIKNISEITFEQPSIINSILSTNDSIKNHIFSQDTINTFKMSQIFLVDSYNNINAIYTGKQNNIKEFEEFFYNFLDKKISVFESLATYIPSDKKPFFSVNDIIKDNKKYSFDLPDKYFDEFLEQFNTVFEKLSLNDVIFSNPAINKTNKKRL